MRHHARIVRAAAVAAISLGFLSGTPASAATNNLTSVGPVGWRNGGFPGYTWWCYCGYAGNVVTSDSDTTVDLVLRVVNGTAEGGASYIAQRSGNPLIWDYSGQSMDMYASGGSWPVHTEASVTPPRSTPIWVISGTVTFSPVH